jgi:hypothetical protein
MHRLMMVVSCETEEVLAHIYIYTHTFRMSLHVKKEEETTTKNKKHLSLLSGENEEQTAGNQLNSS